jgi:catechol 2,3-dioxygenase-like lactoylglutathione lyase family enzyme
MKKLNLLLIALSSTGFLMAQGNPSFNFHYNHLALSVKDVDRSAEFYMKVLRLPEISNRSKIEGVRWFVFADGLELHLISTIKQDVIANKALHLALTTADLDDFVKTLNKLQIAYSDWPGNPQKVNIRADGIKQVFFQDPDGYWIEVNSIAGETGREKK